MTETVLFVPGIGDPANVWEPVMDLMPRRFNCVAVELSDLGSLDSFSYAEADLAISNIFARTATNAIHLVGLSAGAMLALHFAGRHRVDSLFVSGGQLSVHPVVVAVQKFILSTLPNSFFADSMLTKSQMSSVIAALTSTDLSELATQIHCPTTVVCGGRDWPNLSAAQRISSIVDGANLKVIPGVGHQWHESHPALFAETLVHHLDA